MRTRITTRRAALAAAVVACAAAALSLAPLGGAIDQVNEKPAPLGLVGMSAGQTLRLSVAYVKGFDPQPDPPGCQLKVGFADPDGVAIGNPNILELRPGTAQSFDYVAAGDGSVRHYVRPIVSDVNRRHDCPAVVSGELVDRDGIHGIIIYDNQPVIPNVFAGK